MCISRIFCKSSSSGIRYRATENGEPQISSSHNSNFGSTDHFQCCEAKDVRGENGYFIACTAISIEKHQAGRRIS